MAIPKHEAVKVTTIYGEELDGVLIPMSIKASMDIDQFVTGIKYTDEDKSTRFSIMKKTFENQLSDEELKDTYVESKIILDLSKNGEDTTDKRVKAQKEKRFDKLVEGKNREQLLTELVNINIDMEERRNLLTKTVNRTVWHILRKKENLREHLFESIEDLDDSLTQDEIIELFSKNKQESTEEELKN